MKTRWGTCNPDARRVWLNLEAREETTLMPRIRPGARDGSPHRAHPQRPVSMPDGRPHAAMAHSPRRAEPGPACPRVTGRTDALVPELGCPVRAVRCKTFVVGGRSRSERDRLRTRMTEKAGKKRAPQPHAEPKPSWIVARGAVGFGRGEAIVRPVPGQRTVVFGTGGQGGSDDAAVAEVAEVVRAEAEALAEHLVGVLAEGGRGLAVGDRGPRELDGARD